MSPTRVRLRELREANGLSQREIALRTGLTRATLSAIETGKSKGIDFDTLDRLATALGVDPALLIVQDDPPGIGSARRKTASRAAKTPRR